MPDGWKLSEQTLSVNQKKEDWRVKQMKWKEEKTQTIGEKPQLKKRILVEKVSSNIASEEADAATINLEPFEIKAYLISK